MPELAAQTKSRSKILLVDDQPGKLLSYRTILEELDETLLTASSATEALQLLLRNDVAVLLVDVCMPDLDGFEFAAMVREHPRFQRTAIIFISAIHLSDVDSLRGYEMGAVDYVSVPIVPELLRAKVRVFLDLDRKTRELERWTAELEQRVAERTTALEEATKRQELLSREVDHRAKNALAVVQSIVSLTRAPDVESFSVAVHGRIRAMACAHTLLSASRWEGASLSRLAEEELAPYPQGSYVVSRGPPLMLRPAAAQAVAMALHELATNAAKYGALSQPGGKVTLSWSIDGGNLNLNWAEAGGPLVCAPTKMGFGSKVIKAAISQQLRGEVVYHWDESGLRCLLSVPNSPRHESWMLYAGVKASDSAMATPPHPLALADQAILVVEDEPLIALMIADALAASGAKVVGPFNRLEEAMGDETPVDAALLDVNLAGVSTYSFAASLKDRGIPFLFLTGYDEAAVSELFPDVTVLQKPIEPHTLAQAISAALNAARETEPLAPPAASPKKTA